MTRATRLVCLAAPLATLAAAIHAQTAEAQLDRGIEQFHKGEYTAALRTLQEAGKQSPSDARILTFVALTRAALGDCAHAVDELKLQAARASGAGVRRLAALGAVQCLLAANNFPELFPILHALQTDYAHDADVLYEAAKVYNKAWNNAIYQLFQSDPSSYRVNQLSAEIFETQGRAADAAAEYRKAIAKNPSAINLHFRLGRATLLASHDAPALEEARRQFEAELALNPGDAAAEYEIGQILAAGQKLEEAAPHFERAAALAPRFAEALVALAKVDASRTRYDDAVKLLKRAIEIAPNLEAAHYALMMAYRDSGKTKDAQREKEELDKLRKPPEGEFSEFLKKLGEKAPKQ